MAKIEKKSFEKGLEKNVFFILFFFSNLSNF